MSHKCYWLNLFYFKVINIDFIILIIIYPLGKNIALCVPQKTTHIDMY